MSERLDRRHFEHFLAVVDHDGFTSASRALHVSQPALSQTVKALERALGTQLFRRLGHGVRLTSAGEALVAPARQTVRDFETARNAVRNVADLRSGRLDIVAMPGLAADPLAPMLAGFHQRHPRVRMRVTEPGPADIVDVIQAGKSEIAITLGPVRGSNLVVVDLPPEECHLALPPDCGIADGAIVPLQMLETVELIGVQTAMHSLIALIRAAGVEPHFAVETAQREAILPLIMGGVGAALFGPATACEARRRGAVVCRLSPPIVRGVSIVHVKRPLSPAGSVFMSLLWGGRPSLGCARDENVA